MSEKRLRWEGDNVSQMAEFLQSYKMALQIGDDKSLLLHVPDGPPLTLELGDTVILKQNILLGKEEFGIERHSLPGEDHREVTWKGDNAQEFADFLKGTGIDMTVTGSQLVCMKGDSEMAINRGDKLIARGDYFSVSVAGVDHRG